MAQDLFLEDWQFQGRVVNVVDADTLDILIDFGFGLRQQMRFRIAAPGGVEFDAPESWRPKTDKEREHGNRAKTFVEKLLHGRHVCLYSVKRGKYRYVAVVHYKDDSGAVFELTQTLIAHGFKKLPAEQYE